MGETIRAPLIVCDCCGTDEEKRIAPHTKEPKWQKPDGWGYVDVAPTEFATNYPNRIFLGDLCPWCTRQIHEAVSREIDKIHERVREKG